MALGDYEGYPEDRKLNSTGYMELNRLTRENAEQQLTINLLCDALDESVNNGNPCRRLRNKYYALAKQHKKP